MMVSYFEVYNETIVDLLNRSNTGLEIRGSTKDGFYVDNLTEIPVENAEKAMEVYTKGENERTYASTNMNSNSSRLCKTKERKSLKHSTKKLCNNCRSQVQSPKTCMVLTSTAYV